MTPTSRISWGRNSLTYPSRTTRNHSTCSPSDLVMGFTVYASCYLKTGSEQGPAALAALRSLHRNSLWVPSADPILGDFDELTMLEPRRGFDEVAWLFSKVQFALNPPLAEAIFIWKFRHVARRFQDVAYIHLRDDSGDIGDASRIHTSDLFRRVLLGVFTAPIWALFWAISYGGSLRRPRKRRPRL